jgi:hypothetical protein
VNLKYLALIPVALGLMALLIAALFLYDAREPPNPCENFVPKSQWDVCFVPGESDESKHARKLFAALGVLGIGGGAFLIVVGGATFLVVRK